MNIVIETLAVIGGVQLYLLGASLTMRIWRRSGGSDDEQSKGLITLFWPFVLYFVFAIYLASALLSLSSMLCKKAMRLFA